MKTIAIIFFTIMFGLLLHFQSAQAEIYKWIDEKGTVHFTEDPETVPERYRENVKSRITEEDLLSPEERMRVKREREEQQRGRRFKKEIIETSERTKEKAQGPRGECEIIGFSQYEVGLGKGMISDRGTMHFSGNEANYHGTSTYVESKETCVNITIQNNDRETKEITETNVVAITSKRVGTRDRFSPQPFSMQVRPGETSERSVCFGRRLPPISKVELRAL